MAEEEHCPSGSRPSGPPLMADSADGLGGQAPPRWSEKMRIKDDDDDRKVLSKKLSYVLRHGAKQLDLEINEEGYVCVSDVLACDELFAGVALEELLEVVAQSNQDKQRYEVLQQEDGEWLIRATGKHTMQGLARPEPRDKKARRNSNKEAGGSPTNNGDRSRGPRSPGGARPIAEDDFCAKWRLDRLARVRLADLSPANKQLAMQRFNPGPQVPVSDYPKVFVAFCKRFRTKSKDEKDAQDDEAFPTPASPQGGRAVASSSTSSRARKKPAMGEAAVGLLPTGPLLDSYDSDDYERGHCGTMHIATPRSDDDHDSPQALSIHSLGTPVHHPHPPPLSPQAQPRSPMLTMPLDMSMNHQRSRPLTMVPAPPHSPPMGSPQFAAPQKLAGAPPPPTYAPNTRLPSDASFRTAPPPPPTHAPQVDGFGYGSSAEQDCAYQDLSRQHHPGQWRQTAVSSTYAPGQMQHSPQPYSTTPTARATGPSGYQDVTMSQLDYSGGYYDARNTYVQGMPSQGYQDLPPHMVGRGHTAYATHPEPANYHGVANMGSQAYRDGFVVGGDWQQVHASSTHGACY